MSRTIEAIYQNGVLRPAEPLGLAEGSSVRIRIVEPPVTESAWDRDAAIRAANEIAALPIQGADDCAPVSREHDRHLYGDLSEFARA